MVDFAWKFSHYNLSHFLWTVPGALLFLNCCISSFNLWLVGFYCRLNWRRHFLRCVDPYCLSYLHHSGDHQVLLLPFDHLTFVFRDTYILIPVHLGPRHEAIPRQSSFCVSRPTQLSISSHFTSSRHLFSLEIKGSAVSISVCETLFSVRSHAATTHAAFFS